MVTVALLCVGPHCNTLPLIIFHSVRYVMLHRGQRFLSLTLSWIWCLAYMLVTSNTMVPMVMSSSCSFLGFGFRSSPVSTHALSLVCRLIVFTCSVFSSDLLVCLHNVVSICLSQSMCVFCDSWFTLNKAHAEFTAPGYHFTDSVYNGKGVGKLLFIFSWE